jgi:hypothetical protein
VHDEDEKEEDEVDEEFISRKLTRSSGVTSLHQELLPNPEVLTEEITKRVLELLKQNSSPILVLPESVKNSRISNNKHQNSMDRNSAQIFSESGKTEVSQPDTLSDIDIDVDYINNIEDSDDGKISLVSLLSRWTNVSQI